MKQSSQDKTPPLNRPAPLREAFVLAGVLASLALAGKSVAAPFVGNISPNAIEIDSSANLYPSGAAGLVDWVNDSLPNTDTGTLINSVANGIIPNVTGVSGGKGHWNGVRIVDGVGGAENDIFINGGKENDAAHWSIGPGSVGSSKYDITQAYLANNQTSLFFGMERRGNNGTTAFDFEFNQAGPSAATPYIPTRTVGDVLFTFEMSGSGSSGSAVPHYFLWSGSNYVEKVPAPSSLVSSINNADTPAAPWGYVDSKGNWATGSIPRFEFAEASVKLADVFPNFSACLDSQAFVQVRTRSSATDTSDLKDTTKIFQFSFGGPEALGTLNTDCAGELLFDASDSKDSSGGTNLTYLWKITAPSGSTLSGPGITGPDASNVYQSTLVSGKATVGFAPGAGSAALKVNLTVMEGGSCGASTGDTGFTVNAPLSVDITGKTTTGSTLTVNLAANTASDATLQWQRLDASNNWVNIPGANASPLAYSSFEADATPSSVSFSFSGDSYDGKLYQVQIRATAQRTVNGLTCNAVSAPVTIKKITAVDP
jgi:hypothetical protein